MDVVVTCEGMVMCPLIPHRTSFTVRDYKRRVVFVHGKHRPHDAWTVPIKPRSLSEAAIILRIYFGRRSNIVWVTNKHNRCIAHVRIQREQRAKLRPHWAVTSREIKQGKTFGLPIIVHEVARAEFILRHPLPKQKEFEVMYHGTSESNAESISRNGFLVDHSFARQRMFGPGIYVGPFEKAARYSAFSSHFKMKKRKRGAIFKVLIPIDEQLTFHLRDAHSMPFCACECCATKLNPKRGEDHLGHWYVATKKPILHVHSGNILAVPERVIRDPRYIKICESMRALPNINTSNHDTIYDLPVSHFSPAHVS